MSQSIQSKAFGPFAAAFAEQPQKPRKKRPLDTPVYQDTSRKVMKKTLREPVFGRHVPQSQKVREKAIPILQELRKKRRNGKPSLAEILHGIIEKPSRKTRSTQPQVKSLSELFPPLENDCFARTPRKYQSLSLSSDDSDGSIG